MHPRTEQFGWRDGRFQAMEEKILGNTGEILDILGNLGRHWEIVGDIKKSWENWGDQWMLGASIEYWNIDSFKNRNFENLSARLVRLVAV